MSDGVAKSRQAIAEEAAAWFVEFQGPPLGRSVRRRFVDWLSESPVHVEEYLAIAKVYGTLQDADLKEESLTAAITNETVVALHPKFAGQGHATPESADGPCFAGRAATRRNRWLAAAAVVLAIGAGTLFLQGPGPETYSTRVGEQRSIVLEDGSMVSLNTSTSVEVSYSEDTRQVRLIQGEVLFDIQKDATRPFMVETRAAVIRVTGTQFNVYDKHDGTSVTVLEGEVEIAPRGALPKTPITNPLPRSSNSSAGMAATLKAGHKAVVKSGSSEIKTMTVPRLAPVTAWTERRLVFEATPLAEIVQQFNRYNRAQLVIDDPELASLELSGVFGSDDPQSLVLFLRRISDLDVATSPDGTEIRIRAAGK